MVSDMKVSVLTTISRNAGGLFYSVRWLSKALAGRGCDIRVFSPQDEFSGEDRSVWDPLPVELYSNIGPLQSSAKLRRTLSNTEMEILHVHGIWTDAQWAARGQQRRRGTAVVVSPRGMLDPWAVQNAAWKKKLVGGLFANEALRSATCIHALCRSEVNSIRAYGLTNPIAMIPNAVELPDVGQPKKENGARKKLLFLGRIHPKKGLSELVEGWAQAKKLNSRVSAEWHLLIAGWDDGNHLEGLKRQASELGLVWSDERPSSALGSPEPDLCFLGPQFGEEKEALLRNVEAFILPSFSEGLPMSVLEAWAFQLPIVMTDFCNLPEGFEAHAAIRTEPNPESILQGLEHLATLSALELQAMGAKGRNLVEEKFTWPRVAEQMQRVYEWCLTGDNPPDCIEF